MQQNEQFLIIVNDEETSITKNDVADLDSIKTGVANFHLLEKNQAFKVVVIHSDFLKKMLTVIVNGNTYEVKIEDANDQQVKKMGLLAVTAQKVNFIKAPMPGLIVDVMVEVGQEISEGTPLLILSAMKMENIILSHGNGIVKSIAVMKDNTVDKGQLIIEIE